MTTHDFDAARMRPTTKDGQAGKPDMLYGGRLYLLKQAVRIRPRRQHPSDDSYRDSPGSEWLGCHVFEHLGIPVQETLLGTFRGKLACACLDFVENRDDEVELVPFRALIDAEADYESGRRNVELSTLLETLDASPALEPVRDAARRRFWETVVVDAVVGNYDRHPGNWGYLRERRGFDRPVVELAPVFDCGSTFVPVMSEAAMAGYLADPDRLRERVARTPRSNVERGGRAMTYGELLSAPEARPGREILLGLAERVEALDVAEIARSSGAFSEVQCMFYGKMVQLSVETNLQPAFDLACRERGLEARRLLAPARARNRVPGAHRKPDHPEAPREQAGRAEASARARKEMRKPRTGARNR